jgi:hypothetical protein
VLSPFQCHGVHDVANDARPGIVAGFDSPVVARYRSVTSFGRGGGHVFESRLQATMRKSKKKVEEARLLQAFVALSQKDNVSEERSSRTDNTFHFKLVTSV